MILVRRFLGKKIISLMKISALRHLRVSAHIFVALCTSDHKLSLTCYLWSTSLSICLPTWFTVAGITINYAPFCWAMSSGKRIICSPCPQELIIGLVVWILGQSCCYRALVKVQQTQQHSPFTLALKCQACSWKMTQEPLKLHLPTLKLRAFSPIIDFIWAALWAA